jgi:hypothetical protein
MIVRRSAKAAGHSGSAEEEEDEGARGPPSMR